jgi:thiol:disulfide interchange protein DsbG
LFALLSLSISFAVHAANPPVPAANDPQAAVVTFLQSKGYQIGQHFDAGHGLTGWIVSKAGSPNVIYTTNDGEVALIGALIDTSGKNLSADYIERYGANPALPKAVEDLNSSHYIAMKPTGATQRVIYVVFDPNCPYCSIAYKAFKQHAANGIEYRWVPVAYLRPDSAGRAAALLGAPDPAKALEQNEIGFKESEHAGGLAPLSSVPKSVTDELARNDAIMQRIGSSATPTLVWKDDAGHFHDYQGLPPPEMLASILGIAVPR